MPKWKTTDDKPDIVMQMRAQSFVASVDNSATQIRQSAVECILKEEINPFERSGAYILHSINVLIEAGLCTEEVLDRHRILTEIITDAKRGMLEEMDAEEPR